MSQYFPFEIWLRVGSFMSLKELVQFSSCSRYFRQLLQYVEEIPCEYSSKLGDFFPRLRRLIVKSPVEIPQSCQELDLYFGVWSGSLSHLKLKSLRAGALLTNSHLTGQDSLEYLDCTGALRLFPQEWNLPSLKSLVVGVNFNFKGNCFSRLTSLTSLDLSANEEIGDDSLMPLTSLTCLIGNSFSPITNLTLFHHQNLTELRNLAEITSEGLASCHNLKIFVGGDRVESWALSNLTSLTTLDFSSPIEDNSLLNLTNLRHLSLHHPVSSDVFKTLTNLERLSLSECSSENLRALKNHPKLSHLEVGSQTPIEIFGLKNLTQLTALNYYSYLSFPSDLSGLTNLKYLQFRLPPRHNFQIENLYPLTKLICLQISGISLKEEDVSFLPKLKKFQKKNLSKEEILFPSVIPPSTNRIFDSSKN
ncbi:leucine-rich repeat protein [Pithovirus sibericum]|uniref:Leucine-rich repeat protein n=1 Tax=Pithovirus sibericum TaxID=1450746 RepID=W5S4J0_9VIRU|nr:leucine-rich repeat protein [Pithovirus sibericum]AHH01643.1 leucine-rich repeat protein [Pithovirus sibericum]